MAWNIRRVYETALFGRDISTGISPTASLQHVSQTSNETSADEKDAVSVTTFESCNASFQEDLSQSSTLEPVSTGILFAGLGKTRLWKPIFFQVRPLIGLLALFATVSCVCGSFIVLMASHGEPIDKWLLAPTVYLAILTAIGNSALMLSRSLAIPTSWWYNASRGASLQMLQRQWQASHSLFRALSHGRNLSLLSVACIVASLAIMDGALLQRASTVTRATISSNITLDLTLPPELPSGFSGINVGGGLILNQAATNVCESWSNASPMQLKVPLCVGTCQATVRGPGLTKHDCDDPRIWPITPSMLSSISGRWGPWHGYAQSYGASNGWLARNSVFYVDLKVGKNDSIGESVFLETGMASWSPDAKGVFSGQYVSQRCLYTPAILEYNVVLRENIISIVGSAGDAPVVQLTNNTRFFNTSTSHITVIQSPTISGFTGYLSVYVNANSSAVFGPGMSLYVSDPATFNPEALKHFTGDGPRVNFSDPTASIISKYNELMFRGAVTAGALWPNTSRLIDSGVSVNQTVRATQEVDQNVYHTDLRYFAGAAVLQLAAVALVVQLYWGYWTFESPTLSPFDIALAFDSPLFKDVNSASGATGVVEKHGNMQLRFGLVSQGGQLCTGTRAGESPLGRLGMAESGRVERPQPGMRFSS